jgi:hypothetical protein
MKNLERVKGMPSAAACNLARNWSASFPYPNHDQPQKSPKAPASESSCELGERGRRCLRGEEGHSYELVRSSDRGSGSSWRRLFGADRVSGVFLIDISRDARLWSRKVSNFAQTALKPRV